MGRNLLYLKLQYIAGSEVAHEPRGRLRSTPAVYPFGECGTGHCAESSCAEYALSMVESPG